ncbi:unnamed protein product [Dibothriocephalus latus]|uniref:Uncharacterized protein n=1 Tax=Dibothriocephalus latus TaxID=60516 RepID=A0A3P7LNA4_DIBLA|nr:unnamed protein product [Dibothriocephalus latus]
MQIYQRVFLEVFITQLVVDSEKYDAFVKYNFKIFLTTSIESHVPFIYSFFMASEHPEAIIPPHEQRRMLNADNTRWLPEQNAQRQRKVVALISNGKAKNKRMDYVDELAKYIDVCACQSLLLKSHYKAYLRWQGL